MAISLFNLFSIGIGPSSSHTVGPMRAARQFMVEVEKANLLQDVAAIKIDLYGSLALTGKGHATDLAILVGLEGYLPEEVESEQARNIVVKIRAAKSIELASKHSVVFNEEEALLFHKDRQLPYHPNGMRFTIYNQSQLELMSKIYYSVGGGFIVDHETAKQDGLLVENVHVVPYPFTSAAQLLGLCEKHRMTIAQLMLENEKSWRKEHLVRSGILRIWNVMKECVERGCATDGELPGGLHVQRRAKALMKELLVDQKLGRQPPTALMQWVSAWALAVNEENAAGGRVVTAPTNGAAGVIPAVLHYYCFMTEAPSEQGVIDFFLTAAAIGILYKLGASISAAEMGCMGEVGVACSMAAAGLAAALGGTQWQIENAAEIGMEHNLGLTCDPVMGLVQIPCIERNTMGAVKAINATLLAMHGDGVHRVSLDQLIATVRQTGRDMQTIYKETSQGGLAVNVPEC